MPLLITEVFYSQLHRVCTRVGQLLQYHQVVLQPAQVQRAHDTICHNAVDTSCFFLEQGRETDIFETKKIIVSELGDFIFEWNCREADSPVLGSERSERRRGSE